MDPMPLAGAFCDSEVGARAARRYPLSWVQCHRCSLVQCIEEIPSDVLFSEYRYSSSTVPGLVAHFREYASFLSKIAGSSARILEIGCNDGVLLRHLPQAWSKIGVDPSDVAARSVDASYMLVNRSFGHELALDLREEGLFDVVTSSNTLAHAPNISEIFRGVAQLLAPDGVFVLEVHDLDATLRSGTWDTIYHEHKVEWSERALAFCLAEAGLNVESVSRMPLHGGSLRVVCNTASDIPQHSTLRSPSWEGEGIGRLREGYLTRRDTRVYRQLQEYMSGSAVVCAYGASGRANVWFNQLPELDFAFVADDSPLRQRTWLPGVAFPVVAPEALYAGATVACVITAWNYAEDIKASHPRYSGEWLTTF